VEGEACVCPEEKKTKIEDGKNELLRGDSSEE
jgi:hypothetical protein